jgi:hypothetical protein
MNEQRAALPKTVDADRDLVVFLIGMRANKWWHLPVIHGVKRSMRRMLRELVQDPASGLLSFEFFDGKASLMVQYWSSVEHLERYSRDSKKAHLPAWRRWTKEWSKHSAVGIWHETYVVEPGSYECIYHHMPPFGLGKIGPLVTAEGPRRRAEDRRRLHDINQGKGLAHAAH